MTKCPQCGYENDEKSLVCNLCQYVLKKEKRFFSPLPRIEVMKKEKKELRAILLIPPPEKIPFDRLAKVLSEVQEISYADATKLIKDGQGFLYQRLEKQKAEEIFKALQKNGFPVFLVETEKMVTPPSPFTIQKIHLTPTYLFLTDEEGRERKISSSSLILICCHHQREQTPTPVRSFWREKFKPSFLPPERVVIRESPASLSLHLFFSLPFEHWQGKMEEIDYSYLGSRQEKVALANFKLLLKDLRKLGEKIQINQTASRLLADEVLNKVPFKDKGEFDKEVLYWLQVIYHYYPLDNLKNLKGVN